MVIMIYGCMNELRWEIIGNDFNQSRIKSVPGLHPSPKVMAGFFRHKNQHDALIQFAQFLVDLWSVC